MEPNRDARAVARELLAQTALELAEKMSRYGTDKPVLDSPQKVLEQVAGLRGQKKEHFTALYLDARNRLMTQETISVGTLTASLVHPREVFAPALATRAAAAIVVHNHPSGDPTPSAEDREVTRRLARAGALLGVELLDHVVVAENGYYSFKEHQLL